MLNRQILVINNAFVIINLSVTLIYFPHETFTYAFCFEKCS